VCTVSVQVATADRRGERVGTRSERPGERVGAVIEVSWTSGTAAPKPR